ncbi:MAG: diacylglycerol kinase family protein [Bacteroidia bacterium]
MQPKDQHLLFVINPIAGVLEKEEIANSIELHCKKYNLSKSIYFTTGEDDRQKIEEKIRENKFDVVVAVGGDGTVNMLASLLVNTDITLGILPHGSGNGMAKDLEIPLELNEALTLLCDCRAWPIDVLEVNGYYFIHLSDLGFNARVVELFAKEKSRGLSTYTRIALEEFREYEPTRYKIVTDEDSEVFVGKAFMISIANARQFGTRLKINPGGDVADGKFEILIIEPFPKIASPGLFVQMLFENIDDTNYSRVIKATRATIWNYDNAPLHIDGEPKNFDEKLEFRILPSALKVIYPKSKVQDLVRKTNAEI